MADQATNERPTDASVDDGGSPTVTRLTVNLPTAALERLRELGAARGDTLTQVLKHAISLKLAVEEERAKGSVFYLRRADGSHVELLFPY